jgi:DNA-binding transcriptional LysR family regulator
MLDLASLQLFVRACELGSLSKVAADANLALAAVSRRIMLLEAHYGVSLLVRTGRGVEATAGGRALLERARDILQTVSVARADLADFARGLRGSVNLQASTSAITQFLPDDLATFNAICPDIRLDIREAYTAEIIALIHEGTAEVGVVMAGPSIINVSSLPYRRDRLVVVAPWAFERQLTRVKFLDLVDRDFVVMEDSTATTRLLSSVATEAGLPLRLRVKVGSFDAVCRMVQAGFGLGILPRIAAENFEAKMGLRLLDLEDSWAERQMLICTNPMKQLSVAAKRLVDHLYDRANPTSTASAPQEAP